MAETPTTGMTALQLHELLGEITYKDWEFLAREEAGGFLLWIRFEDEHGEEWTGRKWYISRYSTPSEVVQTCLKAVLTAEEHEARESFRFFGAPVFGPHIDVFEHLVIASRLDVRSPGPEVVP